MEAALLSGPRPLVKSPPLISFTSSGNKFPATCRSVSFRHPSMSLTNGSMRISLPNVPRPTSWFLNKLPRPLNKDNNDDWKRTQLTIMACGQSNSEKAEEQFKEIKERAKKEEDSEKQLNIYMHEYDAAIVEKNADLAVLLDKHIAALIIKFLEVARIIKFHEEKERAKEKEDSEEQLKIYMHEYDETIKKEKADLAVLLDKHIAALIIKSLDDEKERANKAEDSENDEAIDKKNADLAVLLDEHIAALIIKFLEAAQIIKFVKGKKIFDKALNWYLVHDTTIQPQPQMEEKDEEDEEDEEEKQKTKQKQYLRRLAKRQLVHKFIIYTTLQNEGMAKVCAKDFRKAANLRAQSFMNKVAQGDVHDLFEKFMKYQA